MMHAEPRWAAVVARDRSADGQFFYSVETTGVYCRPSCPARTPNAENVRFHATAAEAERAGFRACKRCRPDGPSLEEEHAAVVTAACRTIERAPRIPPTSELARAAGLSLSRFHRVFKAVTGVTPRAYAASRRAERVRERLAESPSVTDALYEAGFGSNSRFYEGTDDLLGMTPTAWRSGAAGQAIRFAVGPCSLGAILVARSDRGLCAIWLGDDPDALVRDLQDRFPRADLIGGDAAFEALVARVVGFVEDPRPGLDLPLDVRGTSFQLRVWQALRRVPAGETVSYADLARAIGEPHAVRAVAGACAANLLAVAIPCHRVVRSDGGLSGYRWGVERKRALLDREGG
ncbi:MAG: bifunctional DNA-binding transcriptional regulator/O6-methylguanine-DNA methyltransferase Ada [Myxococcota bacterium]